jgi:hypothetical protein
VGCCYCNILYKERKRENCENNRGINLLCAAYELYSTIISRRINVISDPSLMKNKTDLEEESLVWIAYLQFNNSWKDIQNII